VTTQSARLGTSWFAALLLLPLFLSGCVTVGRSSFSQGEAAVAEPIGFSDVRYKDDDMRLPELLRRSLGSGLIDHSQKMTVAAMQMADMKVWADRS
jgi:hypothetical protein